MTANQRRVKRGRPIHRIADRRSALKGAESQGAVNSQADAPRPASWSPRPAACQGRLVLRVAHHRKVVTQAPRTLAAAIPCESLGKQGLYFCSGFRIKVIGGRGLQVLLQLLDFTERGVGTCGPEPLEN